jgi:hypothetical protein
MVAADQLDQVPRHSTTIVACERLLVQLLLPTY